MKRHLPTIEALTSNDDALLIAELRLSEVRERVALARSLLEQVDRLVPVSETEQASSPGQGLAEHVAEQLARLGCQIVEVATELSRARVPEEVVWEEHPA